MDDWELLRQYAANHSQQAFTALADRYINLVYSAALRQVGDPHLAEDITQGVFIALSQKAASLSRQPPGVLAGWLIKVTRYMCANAIRIETRRRRRETRRSLMTQTAIPDQTDWQLLAPHLDQALLQLSSRDRDAVLLRFFSGKTHRDIANVLKISEDAAKKRVTRAIEKLRKSMGKRGIILPAAALATLLTTHAVQAAPLGLLSNCAALTNPAGAAFSKGALMMMSAAKIKIVAACVIAFLFLACAARAIQKRIEFPLSSQSPKAATPIIHINRPATLHLRGFVYSNSGDPVSQAAVSLATSKQPVDLYNPKPSGADNTTTAEDGAFSLDAPDEPCQIVVRHRLGYAQVTRDQFSAAADKITLLPWGRLEGTLRAGSRPIANETVALFRISDQTNPYARFVTHVRETKTNAQGEFAFDQVAPGDAWIARQQIVRVEQTMEILPIYRYLQVSPGQTLSANLGGTGRAVIGRMLPPADPSPAHPGISNRKSGYRAQLYTPPPLFAAIARPGFAPPITLDEQRQRWEKWSQLPAAISYKAAARHWDIAIYHDGTFRIEDVPPGWHQIQTDYWEHVEIDPFADVLADGSFWFFVPEMPTGRDDQPLNLHTLALDPIKHLKIGQPAPPFTVHDADNKSIQLSDLAGKVILLCLWSKDRPIPPADLQQLKIIEKRHAANKNFALLMVETTNDIQAARQFSAENHFSTSPFLARPSNVLASLLCQPDIPPEYFHSTSTITLIDPRGKIVARNMSGPDIKETVYREIFAQ